MYFATLESDKQSIHFMKIRPRLRINTYIEWMYHQQRTNVATKDIGLRIEDWTKLLLGASVSEKSICDVDRMVRCIFRTGQQCWNVKGVNKIGKWTGATDTVFHFWLKTWKQGNSSTKNVCCFWCMINIQITRNKGLQQMQCWTVADCLRLYAWFWTHDFYEMKCTLGLQNSCI